MIENKVYISKGGTIVKCTQSTDDRDHFEGVCIWANNEDYYIGEFLDTWCVDRFTELNLEELVKNAKDMR